MKYLLIFTYLIYFNTQAQSLRVLNFNTMCDFCHGSDFFHYSKRQEQLKEVIKRHLPDLMSLQELRTVSQVDDLLPKTSDYEVIATEGFLASYADPAIVYNKKKLTLISSRNYWLGPKEGQFSFGWKAALPRQILIAKFEYQGKSFHFLASHFDNLQENLKGALEVLNKLGSELKGPLLFAGDTNIPTDMKLYQEFSSQWLDAFDMKESFQVLGGYQSDKDICYLRKGKIFPACRVEHFLVDKRYDWKIKNIVLDAKKDENQTYPSDHRAYLAEIVIPSDAPQSSSSNQ